VEYGQQGEGSPLREKDGASPSLNLEGRGEHIQLKRIVGWIGEENGKDPTTTERWSRKAGNRSTYPKDVKARRREKD